MQGEHELDLLAQRLDGIQQPEAEPARPGRQRVVGAHHRRDEQDGRTPRGAVAHVLGDLFRQDADGDFWLIGDVRALIATAAGAVAPLPISEALGELDAVDLAVTYGVRPRGAKAEIAVAAVTLRPRARLDAREIAHALRVLAPDERPQIVHVVRDIPLTTWYRPLAAPLRRRGLPRASARAWLRDGADYRPLTPENRARLGSRVAATL